MPADAASCPLRCQNPQHPLSILRRPLLVETACPHRRWRAFPNVAPWEARGLLVWAPAPAGSDPGTLPHLPQRMECGDLEDFLAIARASEGMTTFFNSLHGGASANHLHFQSVACERPLAVEIAARRAHGRYTLLANYPAGGVVFPLDAAAETLWAPLERIQAAGYPFNLIALPAGIFLFVRSPEQEILAEFPGRAFGAINFAGVFITSDAAERARVNEETIAAAYSRMTVGGELLLELLG